jgi:hypothetical protein
MAGANLLSNEALAQVREVVRQITGDVRGTRPTNMPPIAPGPECFLGYFAGGCTAMAGSTPGYGTADLYRLGPTGDVEALLLSDGATANTRTVYNASGTAVASAAYSPVWRDKLGTWWVAPSGGGISASFSGINPGPGNVHGQFYDTYKQWPFSTTTIAGTAPVEAVVNTTAGYWQVLSGGLWLLHGSVTISCDTADSQTMHSLTSDAGGLDVGYRVHPVSSAGGTQAFETVYIAGRMTLTANQKVWLASKTLSAAISGRMFESNMHFIYLG